MMQFFQNLWQSIMNLFIKNEKNERAPYVDEEVCQISKKDMMEAEIIKKGGDDY